MDNEFNEAKSMIAAVLNIDNQNIGDSDNLFTLGLVNSVDFVELIKLIEQKTERKLTLEEILSLTSVNKIAHFITKK